MFNTQPAAQPPMMDDRDTDIAFLSEISFSPQWRSFMLAMASELFGNFQPEEARGFFRQIGARVAADRPLPRMATLQELERVVNESLVSMSWGYCSLGLHDNDIMIVHRAYPGMGIDGAAADVWRLGFAAVLEGVYTQWLQTQGGRSDMRAQALEGSRPDALLFRFGY